MRLKVNGSNLPDSDSGENASGVRLQVWLAHAGFSSRRAAETYIAGGRVSVNGAVVTRPGTRVCPGDMVCVDGREIALEQAPKYVLLNKPSVYVCSLSDENGRPVAADILKPHFSERLYNVGRLDMFSSGLIIFTNDGDFAAKISHPSAELEKEYVVETSLPYPASLPASFVRGVRVDSVFYRCRSAERLNSRRFKVVLVEGKNREIRRVAEHFGVRIKSLIRTRIGNIGLEWPAGTPKSGKMMQAGEFRELSAAEVSGLLSVCSR